MSLLVQNKQKSLTFILFVMAAGLSLFQIWQISTAALGANIFRPVHLSWILILVYLHYPLVPVHSALYKVFRWLDYACIGLCLLSFLVIVSFNPNDFTYLMNGLNTLDLVASIVL